MHGDTPYSPLRGSRSKEAVVTPRMSNLVEQLEEVEVTLKWRGIQKVTRVQLDVSHVSRGVTVRREKRSGI